MKKILIIRMSSIGDIVLATSFLDSVKKQFKDKAGVSPDNNTSSDFEKQLSRQEMKKLKKSLNKSKYF